MKRARDRLFASLLAGALCGCGATTPEPLSPRASLLDPGEGGAGYRSPANWRYHPKQESALLARIELAPGRELFAGERGERWLVDKKKKRVDAAARLAPEPLIAILRSQDKGWLFVGASGTGYEARQPLGPFVRSSAPLDRLARVTAAGSTIVGVTKGGVLTRSADSGGSWQPVGPTDVRFVDVALDDQGHGLALAVPERLLRTDDHGATWKPVDTGSVGAFRLIQGGSSALFVETATGTMAWRPAGSPPLEANARASHRSRYRLKHPPPRGPDAGALAAGRAIVLGDQYLELAEDAASPGRWQLWRGKMHATLSAKPVSRARSCRSVRLAGYDRWLYFACASQAAASTQSIEIFRSSDGGKSFEREPYDVETKLAELKLAVGAGGQLLLTGVCTTASKGRGCSPYGIHHRRIARDDKKSEPKQKQKQKATEEKKKPSPDQQQPRWELALAAAPSLKGSADEIGFSPDGRTAFAVGRRTKNNSFAVFVSRDGGKSFAAREIDQVPPGAEIDSSEEQWGHYYGRRPQDTGGKLLSARAGDDGTFGIVFERAGRPLVVVTDDEGRILSLAAPPAEATTVGLAGSRGLALAPSARQAWETLDGGASWDPIGRLPLDPCPGDGQCQVPLVCHASGCVLGHELSRVGWRGQADDDRGVLARADDRTTDMFDRKIRTPLSCALEEGSWRALDGVVRAPGAAQAAIGKVAWFAAAQDEERAAASVLHAFGGARPRVDVVPLLAPAQRPTDQAIYVSTQVEGVAALRYSTPEATGSGQLKNLELVWENLVEGKLVRARLPAAGPYRPGDYTRGASRAQIARPALFSIGEGGLYLRPHYSDRDEQTTYFVDGQSVQTIPAVRWPAGTSKGTRTEMAHIAGTHVPLMLVGGGAAIVRARRDGSGWAFDALATGLVEPREFDLAQHWDIAYAKDRAGLHVTLSEPQGSQRMALLFPFRASGAVTEPPVRVASQLDTGAKPNRCSATQKSDTPRVVVPYQGGTRHPIVVTDASEPMRVLMTGTAVMHGTPEEPCVAAFDAEIVPIDLSGGAAGSLYGGGAVGGAVGHGGAPSTEREAAVILLDDMDRAWLFRQATQPTGRTRIEYRVMSCRFDPAVEVPPEVYEVAGTLVRRAR
jgi:hypothetical protein